MRSIRGRLLVTLLCGLAVVIISGGSAVYWIAKASLMRQLDAGLGTRARALAALVTFDDGKIEFEFDQGETEPLAGGYFEYRSPAGDVLRGSRALIDSPLPVPADLGDEMIFADVALPDGARGRAAWFVFTPRVDLWYAQILAAQGIERQPLTVAAAIDRGPTDRALATLLGALIAVGCIIAITVFVLVGVGVRWGLDPLDRLGTQLGSVTGTTISKRLDDAGAPRELVPVYRELNRMLDRVEQTIERERSFAGAAAHELRTPLAELRSTAEVAIRWPDTERATTALGELLAIGHEMEHLVESLLLISRGHAAAAGEEANDVAVAAVVHDCLEKSADSIAEKDLELILGLDGDGTLHAPRGALEIIVRNLVDNAVRYTPSRGSITISVGANGDGATALLIENGPVHLDANDLPHLFEPFWRTDGSRTDREHVGLGLTVVDKIAHALGLRVDAALEGERLRMRVVREG